MPRMQVHKIDVLLGKRIKAERKRQKRTLEDVAQHCGISLQMLAHHEQGRIRITVVRLMMIARALRQPLRFFTEGRNYADNND